MSFWRRCVNGLERQKKKKKKIIIGDDIPPGRIMTIDLKLPTKIQSRHDLAYSALIPLLKKGEKNSEGTDNIQGVAGKIDWSIFRILTHLAFSPMLYDFITSVAKEKGFSAYIAKHLERPDLGFSFFYAYTRKDTRVLVPPTRVGQAIYLASESAKLRYLARLFEKEGLRSFYTICCYPIPDDS